MAIGGSFLAAQDFKLSPLEQKNLEIATKEIRDMNQFHHFDLAPQYIAPDYIQHNPNVPPGLDGYVKYMTRFPRDPEPLTPGWKVTPVVILTSGDLVLYLFDRTAQDPADPSRNYSFNSVDLLRVENGLVREHWDGAKKGQLPSNQLPRAPEPVNPPRQ